MYKLAQLILTPGKKAKTISDIFISEPDSLKKSLAGQLFVLIEAENKDKDSLKLVQFLINNINQSYYQNEKLLLREKIGSLGVEHIFEASLAKVNRNLDNFIKENRIKINLKSINILAGVIHEDNIYIANSGKNKALLIYKTIKKDTKSDNSIENKEEYKVVDIIKQSESETEQKISSKIFSNVVNGKIPAGGHFLFANEALPEYISGSQISKIITTLPPSGAVGQLQQILSHINSYISFIGLIIKSTTQTEIQKDQIKKQNIDSIVTLNKSEDQTENLLAPSGIINPKKWLKILEIILEKLKLSQKKDKNLTIKDRIFFKRKSLFLTIYKKIKAFFSIFFRSIFAFFIFLFKIITDKSKAKEMFSNFKENIKIIGLAIIHPFRNLTIKSKALLVILVIIAGLFAYNTFKVKDDINQIAIEEDYSELISNLEQKQSQADAKLLYSNEDGAKDLFSEIQTLLQEFPQNTEEQKTRYNEFKEKFDLQLQKAWRITKVDNAEELANLTNLSSDAKPENIIQAGEQGKIYIADSAQKAVYVLETKDNLVTTITDLGISIDGLREPMLNAESSILYINQKNLIQLKTEDNSFNELSIPAEENTTDFVASDIYNNRLYVVNGKEKQIYVYTIAGQGFSQPRAWIEDKTDISEAADISIDGHIYLLTKTGDIIKLLRGIKQDFKMENLDPPFEDPIKLTVSKDLDYIYILEPKNSRIVVFDKDGEFIMQYQADVLSSAKDFLINEKDKTIYVLSNTSIFKFNASHLTQ